jgi:hypothetical protein
VDDDEVRLSKERKLQVFGRAEIGAVFLDGKQLVLLATDALFRARRTALDEKRADEAADLGRELARIGSVLRDDGLSQYWRPVLAL